MVIVMGGPPLARAITMRRMFCRDFTCRWQMTCRHEFDGLRGGPSRLDFAR